MSSGLCVVLDHDVLTADVLWPAGRAPGLLPLALYGRICAAYTDELLADYAALLGDPALGLDRADVAELLKILTERGRRVRPRRVSSALGLDERRRRLLSCATAAHAQALVCLQPERYGHVSVARVSIVDPAEFAARFLQQLSLLGAGAADKMNLHPQLGGCL